MNNQNYKGILKKYLELSPKLSAQFSKERGRYEVLGNNIRNELIKTRNELEPYLELMSIEELSLLICDYVIGRKAGIILNKRIKETNLSQDQNAEDSSEQVETEVMFIPTWHSGMEKQWGMPKTAEQLLEKSSKQALSSNKHKFRSQKSKNK